MPFFARRLKKQMAMKMIQFYLPIKSNNRYFYLRVPITEYSNEAKTNLINELFINNEPTRSSPERSVDTSLKNRGPAVCNSLSAVWAAESRGPGLL